MTKPQMMVLAGDGINCERETARAVGFAGGEGKIVHVNDLISRPALLKDVQGLIIPGGFSYGDELGSGRILGYKLRHFLGDELERFREKDYPILGICNGFQVLIKMGWLPGEIKGVHAGASLMANSRGHFIDRWVDLEVTGKTSFWTRGLDRLTLPIRHAEGRFVLPYERESDVFQNMQVNGQLNLCYSESDINGSTASLAGICNERGNIFGLMPHPEAACFKRLLPKGLSMEKEAQGLTFFKNAITFLQS